MTHLYINLQISGLPKQPARDRQDPENMNTHVLYTTLTHNCLAKHHGNRIIKVADKTPVVGFITNNNETAYREPYTLVA